MYSKQTKHNRSKIKLIAWLVLLQLFIIFGAGPLSAVYIATNRDTRPDPLSMSFDVPFENEDDYVPLFENETFSYAYKALHQIISITDKRNGYTWTTGRDILTDRDVDDLNDAAIDAGEEPPYPPKEMRLNTIYTGIANSLVSFEYYDEANNLKIRSISKDERVETDFRMVSDDHYVLNIKHREPEVEMNLHIHFTDTGLNLQVPYEELIVPEDSRLSAIILAPFLGATGGVQAFYDPVEDDYSDIRAREMKPGYIMVPDGSGALIRFRNNPAELETYVGHVYGNDPSQSTYYYHFADNAIPVNDPVMPVFGIAHGQNQNAFVAYATEGSEYMQIVVQPEENMTYYHYAYPRFVVNPLYFQPYNKKGDGFFTMMDNSNRMDISMHYDFLQGDGDVPANYVGMALRYQEELVEMGLLKDRRLDMKDDIPLRLDFIMADAKPSVIGTKDQVLSTASDVEEMLDQLRQDGITNINGALMGWQKGGFTLGRADRARFNRSIGSKADFEALFNYTKEHELDVSLYQDYVRMTEGQIGLSQNAAKHVSGYYAERQDLGMTFPTTYRARTSRSLAWLDRQMERLDFLDLHSHTISGLGNTILADYADTRNIVSRTESQAQIVEAMAKLHEDVTLAFTEPNSYLWSYTDRFLQAQVYSSQHLIQTDNVPFLQLVLHGHMEVYGPYANFSFYTKKDILRMIDYNVYPSFVLTKESAHLLADTNLVSFYSTEFSFYRDLILAVYSEVNDALSAVEGARWIDRLVHEPGLIENVYDNGISILINYTDDTLEVDGHSIDGQSFDVLGA